MSIVFFDFRITVSTSKNSDQLCQKQNDVAHDWKVGFFSVPLTMGNLFRILVLGVLALHVFAMYCLAQSWSGKFGFHTGQTVLAVVFSLIMLIPLLWAVTLPEWPEIFVKSFRARKRWKQNFCPECNYDLHEIVSGKIEVCSECGEPFVEPEPYVFSFRMVRRYMLINLLAWVLGSIGGALWIQFDERAFAKQVEVESVQGYNWTSRARRWPCYGSFIWNDDDGFAAQLNISPSGYDPRNRNPAPKPYPGDPSETGSGSN
ncbi:MAG: hypothetical protein O7G85_07425 [Planctomycetota bacterium]|nr:hypothetical protein [Planctomycetota bacterium]